MRNTFYMLFALNFLVGCMSPKSVETSPSEETHYEQSIQGIWESAGGLSKERFLDDGRVQHRLLAYIDGKDILEENSGRWTLVDDRLTLIYDDYPGDVFEYKIIRLEGDELVVSRDDYIDTWTRVNDFEIDESLGLSK